MNWDNLSLYNAKAIKQAKKKAYKSKRKAKKLALALAIKERLTEAEIQAEIAKRKAHIIAKTAGAEQAQKPAFKEPPRYRKGMGKEFYQTREWRELRYSVLVKYGRVCQCCGQTQGYIHVDHIKPRSTHPELELDQNNLQILCEACNIGKSNKDATDWRTEVSGVALAPSKA